MSNSIKFSDEARSSIIKGIKTVYDSVKVTLGPKGRNVIIEQDFGVPLIINDGVTIAKNIELKDKFENLGACILIEAATKTNDASGDGTTTAVVLSSNLIFNGVEALNNGVNPVEIKNGFEYYLPLIINKIKSRSIPVNTSDDLEVVATLSSGSKEIGKMISGAYEAAGKDAEVSIEESRGIESSLELLSGYSYDRGFASSYMATDEAKKIATLENGDVLVTDKKIQSMKEILPFLENSMKKGSPLLIVCDDIEQEVLSAIVVNKLRGVFNVVITKAPSFGDKKLALLKDISVYTNATLLSVVKGDDLSSAPLSVLGHFRKAIIDSNKTVLFGTNENSELINDYVNELKSSITKDSMKYDVLQINERCAKLSGKVAVIKVGAATEPELKDKKLRLEDALNATKAAMESGTIEGAGKVFFEIADELNEMNEFNVAKEILVKSLKEPFYQILRNAGVDHLNIKDKLSTTLWFDAATSNFVSLRSSGIIDPASVEITAITNAISIAGTVLSTECAIIKDENVEQGKMYE